jgi:DSBA-like thioredoxin domain
MQVEVWADIICPWCGLGTHAQAWNRLFTAYFGEARPIFTVEDLVTLAGEIGLDPEDAREALLSHRYAARVTDEARDAGRAGRGRRAVLRDRPPLRRGGRPASRNAARGLAAGLGRAAGAGSPGVTRHQPPEIR